MMLLLTTMLAFYIMLQDRGRQATARVPHLAQQEISNGTQKLQVSHINFVMIHHAKGILTLTCTKKCMLLAR